MQLLTFVFSSSIVSHKFGYGLMDAEAMVTLAERWHPVPPQRVCEMPPDTVER